MLLRIDGHVTFHGGEDASLQVGRTELRVGLEVENSIAALDLSFRPDESLGKHLEHFRRLLVIVLAALMLLGASARVLNESIHLGPLVGECHRLAIEIHNALQVAIMSLRYPLIDG